MKIVNTVLLFTSLILFSSCSKNSDSIVTPSFPNTDKTIFVDPVAGNDANNGRETSSPFKTLLKAGSYATNGDTIYVKGGIYTHFKDEMRKSSTELGYIFLRPYPGQTVVFDGTGGTYQEAEAILTIKNSTYIDISGFEIR